jgi:exopolyphosphatase / guanosine-5'-triphosphate,3'-diphosphate pyrophosphatase
MRMGVLDIGSNTGHLLVVDAYRGGPPVPAHSFKEALRLSEHLDGSGAVSEAGIERLVKYVREARAQAEDQGCSKVLAFATSAVRDAINSDEVLEAVRAATGVEIDVMPGEDEARLTFLAVRRWFGWSSGRLGVFDIGGGSLELAVGSDEEPSVASSLPLGAGRLTRDWLAAGRDYDDLRRHVRAEIADAAGAILRGGRFDRAVATSKTFRSLARICGSAPYEDGPYVRRTLNRANLVTVVSQMATLGDDEISTLPGVSPDRAHQMRAGAVVAEATMDLFDLDELEICPWALREGVLLRHMDYL